MSSQSLTRKILFVAWLFSISLIALLFSFTMGAAVFRHVSLGGSRLPTVIQEITKKIAQTPSLIKQAANELIDEITGKPSTLLIPKSNVKTANFFHKFPAPQDDGYLLLSSLNGKEAKSIVQLIRIADGQIIAKWVPDWSYIHHKINGHRFGSKGNPNNYRAIHPLLLRDASLIFNTGSSLIRLPLCSSKPYWVLDYPYHHSIELSSEGQSVWVPSVTEVFATDNDILKAKLRDDSLSEVSLDGKVLQNLSFSRILLNNNKVGHMLGSAGLTYNLDPLHINQITPAKSNTPYWKRFDLLISARHTSSLYIYRPSTGKIIWHQQGPWLNQHSAHFVNDDSIAVFGNNVYGNELQTPFMYTEGHNQIYIFDFKTAKISQLHSDSLSLIKPTTITEGRVRVLDDAGVFVEETNNARLFKLNSAGQLIWSYVNTYDEKKLGAVSWSRYITRKELQDTIQIDQLNCSINENNGQNR